MTLRHRLVKTMFHKIKFKLFLNHFNADNGTVSGTITVNESGQLHGLMKANSHNTKYWGDDHIFYYYDVLYIRGDPKFVIEEYEYHDSSEEFKRIRCYPPIVPDILDYVSEKYDEGWRIEESYFSSLGEEGLDAEWAVDNFGRKRIMAQLTATTTDVPRGLIVDDSVALCPESLVTKLITNYIHCIYFSVTNEYQVLSKEDFDIVELLYSYYTSDRVTRAQFAEFLASIGVKVENFDHFKLDFLPDSIFTCLAPVFADVVVMFK